MPTKPRTKLTKAQLQLKASVNAAGRMLSQANAEDLRSALNSIRAGADQIESVLERAGAVEPGFLDEDDDEKDGDENEVEAGSFTEDIARTKFCNRIDTLLSQFRRRYLDLHCNSEAEIDPEYGTDRQSAIANLITEMEGLLKELLTELPEPIKISYDYYDSEWAGKLEAASLTQDFKTAIWHQDLWTLLCGFSNTVMVAALFPLDYTEYETEDERRAGIDQILADFIMLLKQHSSEAPATLIEAKGVEPTPQEHQEITLQLSVRVAESSIPEDAINPELAVPVEARSNLHPIQVTLFPVDRVSDCAPQVGPGLPLYVPRSVAEAALGDVANKPLEMDPTMAIHNKRQPIGVMTSAEIVGDEFVAHGYVWPYNKPQEVKAIQSAQEVLGASINADTRGHVTTINGRQCYCIDELNLKGAAILFADLATWRDTKVSASGADPPNEPELQAIAANAATTPAPTFSPPLKPQGTVNSPMDPELKEQLDKLVTGITTVTSAITGVQGSLSELQAKVGVLEAERQQQLEAQARKEEAEREQAKQQALIEAVGASITEKIGTDIASMVQQQVAKAINPRGVPMRPGHSRPLVPNAAADTKAPLSQVDLEIANLEGQLKHAGLPLERRLAIKDQIRNLQAGKELIPV